MRTETVQITPTLARDMLKKNKSNRPVNSEILALYVRDMLASRWKATHQGLCIGKGGVVIDGQHRLLAIEISGKAQTLQVTYDDRLASHLDLPIDVGYKRNADVVLGTSKDTAALGRLAASYVTGKMVLSALEIKPYCMALDSSYKEMKARAPTCRRKVTVAPIMLAAITVAKASGNSAKVFQTYADMSLVKLEELDPLPRSFLRQIVIDDARFTGREAFARAYRALDPSRAASTKLIIKDESAAFVEARAGMMKAFGFQQHDNPLV